MLFKVGAPPMGYIHFFYMQDTVPQCDLPWAKCNTSSTTTATVHILPAVQSTFSPEISAVPINSIKDERETVALL